MRSTRITGLSVSMLISGHGRRLLCLVRSCQESKGKKVVDLVRRRTARVGGCDGYDGALQLAIEVTRSPEAESVRSSWGCAPRLAERRIQKIDIKLFV
jgi:hypothetical protein